MTNCWNCGSHKYVNFTFTERCGSCGILCDYLSGTCNPQYEEAMARAEAPQTEEDQ